jgi:nucleoside-diphosphate-sugar epimerase
MELGLKRVLLTGGSGFIGLQCIEPLLARGYEVHATSTKARGSDARGVHWHEVDLLQADAARELVATVKPTHLLHLAWFVVPGKLIAAAENFAWVSASMALVDAFAREGGKRLVVSGSAYEYDWNYGFCNERLTPAVPNTPYGACKQALATLVQSYAANVGLSASWGRVFFLYGPHEHPQRLVSSVILSLLKGEPAKCSHGRQIRDYMHVQDVADGLVAVLDSDVRGTLNVCSAQATTLREIVTAIGDILQRPELILLGAIPARANDAPMVVGDNSRMRDELAWNPQWSLDAGLRQTIAWWRDQR